MHRRARWSWSPLPVSRPLSAVFFSARRAQATATLVRERVDDPSDPRTPLPLTSDEQSRAYNYVPKYRPRKIAMPVDPEARTNHIKYPTNALQEAADTIAALREDALAAGATQLGKVPSDRTVADAFGFALATATERGWLPPSRPNDGAQGNEVERSTDLFDWLSRTPLSSPVHGGLAAMGRALVREAIIARLAEDYPRLGSTHHNRVVHSYTGLLPCCRAAFALGLVDATGLAVDVGLWRERNNLELHRQWAAKGVSEHTERQATDLPSRATPLYRRHAGLTKELLAKIPGTRAEVQPRIEWLQCLLFALFGLVRERNGALAAETLALRVLAPELLWLSGGGSPDHPRPPPCHPLTHIAELRALARRSFAGVTSTVLFTDLALQQDLERFPDVPSAVVQACRPDNAFKEAQLLIRYDPCLPAELRDAPIDAQVEFVTTEVHQRTELHAAVVDGQEAADTEHRVLRVKLVAGHRGTERILGIGYGATERIALDAAARHMVLGYYTRSVDK